MERNLKLTLAYDGTEFHGWQVQPGVRTVQQEVQQALAHVVRHPVALIGASRTDAGVHARGQVAHVHTSCSLPVENLRRAVEDRLPADVSIVHAADAPPDFHATRDAHRKLYRYTLFHASRRPVPELATRCVWHVWHALDLERMRIAADVLVGTHDFAAFASRGSQARCLCHRSSVRTIYGIDLQRRYDRVWIAVEGGGFLYNQVRIMVGTLVEIGRGHWPSERIPAILESKNRTQAGPTAPAEGLSLEWVRYGPLGSADHGA